MKKRERSKEEILEMKDRSLKLDRLFKVSLTIATSALIFTGISITYNLLEKTPERYKYTSQWKTESNPEHSSGLSVITNSVNYKKELNLSMDTIRKEFPPDDGINYTMEHIEEALEAYGVINSRANLDDKSFREYLEYSWVILPINNSSITYSSGSKEGRGYKEEFQDVHYVISIGYEKVDGLVKVKVYDPYLEDNFFRLYDLRELDEAVSQSNYDYGIIVK